MSDDFKMVPAPGMASDSLIEALSDIAAGLNPETLLGNRPVGRRFDLHYDYASYRPADEVWTCIDLNTYDGAPDAQAPCTFIGRGKTEVEARNDLLTQFAEQDSEDNPEPEPKRPTRVVNHSAAQPPDVIDDRDEIDPEGDDYRDEYEPQ